MLGLTLLLIIGLVLAIGSTFYLFAIGMSDSPREGRPGLGCSLSLVGLAMFVVALIAIIARLF
jgi:hypothetical protein